MHAELYHQYQHDYKPTHPIKPQYLIDACAARDAAWAAVDSEIELQIAEGEFDPATVDAYRAKAITADRHYYREFERWQNDIRDALDVLDASECSCTGLESRACNVCATIYEQQEIPY